MIPYSIREPPTALESIELPKLNKKHRLELTHLDRTERLKATPKLPRQVGGSLASRGYHLRL